MELLVRVCIVLLPFPYPMFFCQVKGRILQLMNTMIAIFSFHPFLTL